MSLVEPDVTNNILGGYSMAISHWELAVINVIEGIMVSPIRLIPINTTTIVL